MCCAASLKKACSCTAQGAPTQAFTPSGQSAVFARSKIYRYRLYRGKVVPPMLWRYVLHYPFPLDEDAMRDASARFVGMHDFTSFAASTGSEEDDKERSTEREIYSTE